MKQAILLAVITTIMTTAALADVCQIKTRTDVDPKSSEHFINAYALKKGDQIVHVYYDSDIDLNAAVSLRDNLISKGVCEQEAELEKCSIQLDPDAMNPVALLIGNNVLTMFGSTGGVDNYSINVANERIQNLRALQICK